PGESWIRPRAPFRFSAVPDRDLQPPTDRDFVFETNPEARVRNTKSRVGTRKGGRVPGERPFAGLRVVDFTAFWSGPWSTAWLSSMGADVIKVESVKRPDGL